MNFVNINVHVLLQNTKMKILILLTFIFFIPIKLSAHEKKAFPILMDKQIGKDKLSIWADPDLDKGTFDLFIDGVEQSKYQIQLKANPVSDPSHVLATKANFVGKTEGRQNFTAVLPFDREVMWNVEFGIKQNEGTENTFRLLLNVTAPGPGKGEFALYLLPFLLVFLLGMKILITKLKLQKQLSPKGPDQSA